MELLRPNNILILCTGNSCRSQIAEGYLRILAGSKANIFSAGIETHGVNPNAIQVMDEDGIDISFHSSNKIEDYSEIEFHHIITVCDHAANNCPQIKSDALRHHFNFPDPANATGTEEEIIEEFRIVRDLIKEYIEKFALKNLL